MGADEMEDGGREEWNQGNWFGEGNTQDDITYFLGG